MNSSGDVKGMETKLTTMKNTDNGFANMRGKYVLRTRPSWTGVYVKEPWPRERKIWEKV